jgi:putative acetyltransferase
VSAVLVRPETAEDRPDVRRLVAAAFGDDGPHVVDLVEALDSAGRSRAGLVAEADGVVVGHVLSQSWVDARQALVEVLVLSPLAVDPAAQGRGIGTTLLAAAVAARARVARRPSSWRARPPTTARAAGPGRAGSASGGRRRGSRTRRSRSSCWTPGSRG